MKDDIVFGIRAIIEVIKAGREIEKVLLKRDSKSEQWQELYNLLKKNNIPCQFVPIEKINRITRKNHQGVIAYISQIEYHDIDNLLPQIFESGKIPLLLILDKITDVRNFGSIARTAECAGVDAIITSTKGKALINSDAMKTSAGALTKIPVCRVDRMKDTISTLKESGIQIISASEKSETIVYNADFSIPTAIIMGSEEKGIAQEFIQLTDKCIKIPLHGTVGSLNVAVAAAVVLYEAVRQRITTITHNF